MVATTPTEKVQVRVEFGIAGGHIGSVRVMKSKPSTHASAESIDINMYPEIFVTETVRARVSKLHLYCVVYCIFYEVEEY